MSTMIDMTAVETLFNHYHSKVEKYPELYAWESMVHVPMPVELKEYCNRSGGTSGPNMPNGIRIHCANGFKTRNEIFSTVASLAYFIVNHADMDFGRKQSRKKRVGSDRTVTVSFSKAQMPKLIRVTIKNGDEPASKILPTVKDAQSMKRMLAKYGMMMVNDVKTLTWDEFALRYWGPEFGDKVTITEAA